jgi:hypothetical protein
MLAILGVPDISLDFQVTIRVLPASSVSKLLPWYVAVPSTVFVLFNSRVHFALFFSRSSCTNHASLSYPRSNFKRCFGMVSKSMKESLQPGKNLASTCCIS